MIGPRLRLVARVFCVLVVAITLAELIVEVVEVLGRDDVRYVLFGNYGMGLMRELVGPLGLAGILWTLVSIDQRIEKRGT